MEKTINCENCTREYTFEENQKFPRKYCDVCSKMKKEAWTESTNGDAKPEVVKIPTATGSMQIGEDDPLEYQIRSREVRCRALECAIKVKSTEEFSSKTPLYEIADKFVEWIYGKNM